MGISRIRNRTVHIRREVRGLLLSGIPELVLLSLAFMLGDGDKYMSILVAALLHELGHMAAAALLGVKMRLCKAGMAGISLQYDFSLVSHGREAIVCLAGPVVGVVIFFLGYKNGVASYFAGASLGLTVLNLLPISFLDGGCALTAILSVFLSPDKVWHIVRGLSFVFTILLWVLAIIMMLSTGGDISFICASVYLLYRLFSE